MPNLLILVGIPGCGKSTWARTFFGLNHTIISSDEIRKELFDGSLKKAHEGQTETTSSPHNENVFSLFHYRISEHLLHGNDVIADATSLNKEARETLRNLAADCFAQRHLVVFKNLQEALERNNARDEESKVPEEVMGRMVKKYYDTLAQVIQESYHSVTYIERFS